MVINQLIEFESMDNIISYFAKGTYGIVSFVLELKRQWDVDASPAEVHHCHARFCPVGPDYDPPSMTVLLMNQKPGRGAFPITYIDVY